MADRRLSNVAQHPASADKGDGWQLDAKRTARYLAQRWAGFAAHTVGLGWFIRRQAESIWTPDEHGVEVRNRIRQLLTTENIAKPATQTRAVEVELRDEMHIPPDAWDADGNVLGLPDGRVWDIAQGKARTAGDEGRISKRLGAVPEAGEPELWLTHLNETFADLRERAATVAWLRGWLRYSLGASCEREEFVFLVGPPGGGKSTLAETWARACGSYSATVAGERIAGEFAQHRQWLAQLHGVRLCLVGELPASGQWDTANLNAIVSGESVEANRMRENSINFHSTSKVLITGNHRPRAASGGGLWRRMRMVRCDHVPKTKDEGRKARLQAEIGRILWWALSAPRAEVPESIDRDTASYRDEQDALAEWFEECIETDDTAYALATDLYASYTAHGSSGGKPMSRNAFGRLLTERLGTTPMRLTIDGATKRVRIGIQVK